MGNKKYIYMIVAVLVIGLHLQISPSSINYSSIDSELEVSNDASEYKGNLVTRSIKQLINFTGLDTKNVLKSSDSSIKQNDLETIGDEEDAQLKDQSQAIASSEQTGAEDNAQDSKQLTLPVLNAEDIKTVDFKMLTKKGKVNIVVFDGTTYLDITSLANWYGRKLGWDYEKDQFICILFGIDFRGESFGKEIYINGNSTSLTEPIYIIDNKPYIPAKSFAEGIGAEVVISKELLEVRVRNLVKVKNLLLRS